MLLSFMRLDEPAAGPLLCGATPVRAPMVLPHVSLRGPNGLLTAMKVPMSFFVCNSSNVRCHRRVSLTNSFSRNGTPPPAAGLSEIDDLHVRRQFWYQWHPEAAPQSFGWLWNEHWVKSQAARTPAAQVARVQTISQLNHRYSIGVGRVLSPNGGFVEVCSRCPHEGAIFAPPSGSEPGANLLVDWRANIIKDPPARAPRRARESFYAQALRSHPVQSFGRLLVLLQRFSSDYGHFLTELLPRAVSALPEVRADSDLRLLVDCSSSFVRPWLLFVLGVGEDRLVCTPAKGIVHADCLAFSRFDGPFTSGFRLGLDLVRTAAHSRLPPSQLRHLRKRRVVIWADRDLTPGSGTKNRVRHVEQTAEILKGLARRLPSYRIVSYQGSKYTPRETVRLFANAAAVIGPSGSALHNVVFCSPGATSHLHLHLLDTCISFTPASPSHLHLLHTCNSFTPASHSQRHVRHTCISFTSASPSHLHLLHTCISFTPPASPSQLHLMYICISFTALSSERRRRAPFPAPPCPMC